MKIITSTNGYEIQVSDEDFEYLNQWNWSFHSNVISRTAGKKTVLLSHEILKRRGITFKDEVDHKDRNRLNNQFENLRPATRSQNCANRKLRKDNSSGFRGVYFDKRRNEYLSQISIHKFKQHLGCFHDPVEAAKAYDKAATHYFGEFASLNFP